MYDIDMLRSINMAVSGDHVGLNRFTDVDSPAKTFAEVATHICHEIQQYQKAYKGHFINVDNGYIFYIEEPKMLVSFCLHVKARTRRGLDKFWNEIVEHTGGEFTCFLWGKNTRAIKWLVSRGMRVDQEFDFKGNKVVKLCLSH